MWARNHRGGRAGDHKGRPHDRMAAARLNLANAEAIGRIVGARVDAGSALASEGLRQRIVVRRQTNALRTLELDVLKVRASLALMVGESVWDFDVEGETLADLALPEVVPGLPSELLLRRPDIVQAEAALREARADVDLARLAFLPRISLTGSGALGSTLANLAADATTSVGATSGLVLGLFHLGRGQSGLDGLADRPGRGVRAAISPMVVEEVVVKAGVHAPGMRRRNTRTTANEVGIISASSVGRIWRENRLKPHLKRTFKQSNAPQFEAKFWDVVGLYLASQKKSIVLCCDEKTIQGHWNARNLACRSPFGPIRTDTHDYVWQARSRCSRR